MRPKLSFRGIRSFSRECLNGREDAIPGAGYGERPTFCWVNAGVLLRIRRLGFHGKNRPSMLCNLISGRRQYLKAFGIAVAAGDDHRVDKRWKPGCLPAVDDHQWRALNMMLHGVVDIILQHIVRRLGADARFQAFALCRCGGGYFPHVADVEVSLFLEKGGAHLMSFGGPAQTD